MTDPRWAALAALCLTACGTEPVDAGGPTPTYTQHVAPLYARACVTCHSSWGQRAGGVELDTYAAAFNTRVKSVCTAITPALVAEGGDALLPAPRDPPEDRPPCADWAALSMPPAATDRLTEAEQRILLRWVLAGAPE